MDEALQVVIEMSEFIWHSFKKDLESVTPEEVDWRPMPEANSINLILRHLLLEAQEHLAKIEGREPQEASVTVPLDFNQNLKKLEDLYTCFIAALRQTTLDGLEQKTALAYQHSPRGPLPPHFLAFHLTLHLVMHFGQIRTIRNLYKKKRGEPWPFANNPTFPP